MSNSERKELQEKRGLRFPFSATAELLPEGAAGHIPAQITELSFRGCFLKGSPALQEHQRVQVKIFHGGEFFEALAKVIYVRPDGVGLVFGDVKPHFRGVLQGWLLSALDQQAKPKR